MGQYRKKPVVIEAFKWTGAYDQTENPVWIVEAIKDGRVQFENELTPDVYLTIDTLEGVMKANQGDWIIRGLKGELYPCKPDIFEASYELVEDSPVAPKPTAIQPVLEPLELRVLFYLREAFEDDPNSGPKDTSDIAEALDVSVKELYDHDHDTGALFILKERGDVSRCGWEQTGWSWVANGASIVWQ